jgi:hypothetical protein
MKSVLDTPRTKRSRIVFVLQPATADMPISISRRISATSAASSAATVREIVSG